MKFFDRYPHGVLTEQEGGVSNDAENWEAATHVCRKHKRREAVCLDVAPNPSIYVCTCRMHPNESCTIHGWLRPFGARRRA